MENAIGIVDEANAGGNKDNLGIQTHTNSLIRFISSTNTPITVGIQGEWGSGKTSLINSIHYAFESEDTVKQIWINSWEYSLLSTPEEALLKIVNRIIDELLESDTDVSRKTAIKEGAGKIFRGALRVGAQVALGTEAAKVANELLDSSGQSISTLRQQLTSLVQDVANRASNPFTKVIVYVDDLDRIEPRNAVAILELLKNIFSIPKCVFILAIDYQVVVKGLEHKFGKQTAENEWEFRAFFDKIIQLPFMMPMGQYDIGKYVNALLLEIGFVEGEGLDDEAVREIILRTIGGNPRSIKRLVNSVSLIQIFTEEKVKTESSINGKMSEEDQKEEGSEPSASEERFLLFALLCLQIAYPQIYSLLSKEPNFPIWNDELAYKETNRSEERVGTNEHKTAEESKKIFDTEFETAKKSDDFNEEWEQALYRICYGRPRLKPRVSDISKFFSYIKDDLLADKPEELGEIVAEVLSKTSVTSVTTTDQGQIILPERQGAYQRRYLDGIDAFIQDGQENQNAGAEAIELMRTLHAELKDIYQEAEFKFHGGMTGYANKHKFFGADFDTSKGMKNGVKLQLIRHFGDDYKMPIISDLRVVPCRKFGVGKLSTAHNCDRYIIWIPDLKSYEINKLALISVIKKSIEMASDHWEKRLKIEYRNGLVSSAFDEINDSEDGYPKVVEACLKYLDPDHKYHL
jgi:hypothetical protein